MESSTSTLLLLLRPPPPPPPPPTPPWRFSFSFSHSRFRFLLLRRSLRPIAAARKFDFGPRSYDDDEDLGDFDGRKRSKRRRRRRRQRLEQSLRWWFDEKEFSELDERLPNSMLDQVIDSLWFLKVLKSYGWFSPFILLSLLLATGPKAFLMAFSIPLGLSLLALAFKKLSTWLEGTPEPKTRRQTKSPFTKLTASSMEEEEYEEDEEESQLGRRSQKSRYKSTVASNNGPAYNSNSSSKFGGWDELIREEVGIDRAARPDQKTNETNGASRLDQKTSETDRVSKPDQITDEQKTSAQEALSNIPVRERELPLLLKLLVALFPFLGSWISSF